MPAAATRADSIGIYLTGAASNGGAQTDPDLSLGNHRSTTEVPVVSSTVTSPISGLTIDYIAGANPNGSGTLEATGTSAIRWTPPGGTVGANVTIANGETKILEGGGTDGPGQYVRITRTSASNLTGTATVVISDLYNNAIGFDNVVSAEATAGDDEYRAVAVYNRSVRTVNAITLWVGTVDGAVQQVSNSTQLSSSGSGTITTTGSFATWPESGYALVRTSGGTTREIVYYSSRTSTALTVPTGGRARLGTTAAAGNSSDTIDAHPGIRIATEAPASQPAGAIQTIANEGAAPTGVTWSHAVTEAGGIAYGNLAAGYKFGLWIHRHVVAGSVASPSLLNLIRMNFEAA